jgi:translocator protein
MTARTYSIINLIAFIAMVILNYLSNSLPLNGNTPAQLSDRFPNLFVPAGATFAIWGVIYTLLLVWVLVQFTDRFKSIVEHLRWLFAITCVLNIGWLLAWHWHLVALSACIMVVFLVTLIAINTRLYGADMKKSMSLTLSRAAFGIYQGWITVALIANITALLVTQGWKGGGIGEDVWAIALIIIGGSIALYMTWVRGQLFHGIAVAWALFGIYLKRAAYQDAPNVQMTALGMMIIVLLAVVARPFVK